jgi:hypothetical protein
MVGKREGRRAVRRLMLKEKGSPLASANDASALF